MSAINRGFFISAGVSVVRRRGRLLHLPAQLVQQARSAASVPGAKGNPQVIAFVAVLIGLVLAASIQLLTGYFTETNRKPVRDIVEAALTGPATTVLAGISVGLESAVYSALLIGAAVYGAFLLGMGTVLVSLFAVALAGTGLLTTVGVIVSMDTFGPVSDNAQGIAEMSGDIDEKGARVLTDLDAVGNTTKAITKGIAIATAVLAATALFGSFTETVQTEVAKAFKGLPGTHIPRVLDIGYPRRPRRPDHRRRGGLPLLRPGHQRGVPRCRPGRLRGARAVPYQARDHGRHRAARLRPRRRHLHP